MGNLLKQFEGWATDLWSRYRSDIFFRTEWNVIALQVLFGVAVLIVFWVILQSVQENIGQAMAESIAQIIQDGELPAEADILAEIEITRTQELFKLFLVAMLFAIVFGYIISHVTLSPARSALESQKRFISNIAHELRTPLSIIKTNTEVLLMRPDTNDHTREKLGETIEELDRSSDIINNLLSLDSYLQPNRVEFHNVDLGKVADEAVKKLESLAQSKGVGLSLKKSGSYRLVWGSTTALEQVAVNLIRNSITHTPEDGHVVITVTPDYRGHISLTVRDTGEGIRQKDLFHIFEPYYRGEDSRIRGSASSGLGLTIVSEIVKSHHGKISVKSAEGRGTVVTILLPCGTEPPATIREAIAEADVEFEDEVAVDFSRPQSS